MKAIKLFFISLVISVSAHAETVYVTENLRLDLRKGPSNGHKIIKMVKSGSPLTVIEKNTKTGYSKVRTEAGLVGYVVSRYTQTTPASRELLEQANIELEQLRLENKRINADLLSMQTDNQNHNSRNLNLTNERDQLSREIRDLKQTAGSAIQIKQQRDQLQERVVNLERENQELRRENQALEDTSNQDWFLNGGIVAFFGIFFGLIIPKLTWQRRRSSWDSF